MLIGGVGVGHAGAGPGWRSAKDSSWSTGCGRPRPSLSGSIDGTAGDGSVSGAGGSTVGASLVLGKTRE